MHIDQRHCTVVGFNVCHDLQGLERLAEYDYVAIFDADFKPDADFLVRVLCGSVGSAFAH